MKAILAAALAFSLAAAPAVAQEARLTLACQMMIASMDTSMKTKKTVMQEKPTLKVQYENAAGPATVECIPTEPLLIIMTVPMGGK